ncbi:MAG: hypothetical protein AB1641_11915 [Thermodesulfobacteriota bacterium]
MNRRILAPLCSAFVLPGLGQIVNRQIGKGVIMIMAVSLIFLAVVLKVFMDLSAVMGQLMGPDLTLSDDKLPLFLAGLRARNLTPLFILLILGFALWAYSVIDAYVYSRKEEAKIDGDRQ